MCERAICSRLSYSGRIKAIVGDRITPQKSTQQAVYPRVTYSVVSTQHVHSLQAASGTRNSRVQIDCYAEDYRTVVDLSEAVRLILDGYKGEVENVELQAVLLDSMTDQLIEPGDANQKQVHVRSIDFMVWHSEAVPTFS